MKKPIFYLHHVSAVDPSSPSPLSPSPSKKSARTVVFKANRRAVNLETKSLALLCAEDAELGSNFSVLVREKSGEIKVEKVAKDAGLVQARPGPEGRPSRLRWECFGAEGIAFRRGNFPALVSHWIGSPDGFVMVSPGGGEDEHWAYVFATI